MARVFSPTAPEKEHEGFLAAARFFTAEGRQNYSRQQVLWLTEQYCQRLRQSGQGDRARGFETAGLAIAQARKE